MRLLIRYITLVIALLAAPLVHAGDKIGGYILVVGSTPSTIPVAEMTDVAKPVFRETIAELSKEWSDKCEARVDIWHTNLIYNESNPWTPDYWVAYIAFEKTEAEVDSVAPTTSCNSESYTKYGEMTFPSLFQICAQPEIHPDLYEQSCQ